MAPEPTRRDFLKAGRIPQHGAASEDAPLQPGMLLEIGRDAMACRWEIYLNAGQYKHGQAASIDALDLVEDLEAQLTVYNDQSELSRLNFDAAESPVSVEPRFFALLQESLDLYQATNGAFDITASPLSKLWGFHRREGRIPDEQAIADTLQTVSSNHIQLKADNHLVAFSQSGVEINLGGIGKGYALDRCAESLVDAGIDHFLIHGGQSSILARGCRTGQQRSWTVGVRHPLRPDRRLVEVVLDGRALGTSGTAAQSFFHQGRRYGHILDPRTGQPAESMLSTSVVAPTAAVADALATAFYVMGMDASLEYLAEHPEIGAILASPATRQGSMHLEVVGLADEDLLNLAP